MKQVLLTALALAGCALIAAPAWAAPVKSAPKKDDDVPPGAIGSGAITLKQIVDEVQYMVAEKYGIVVHFVLPKGWELKEQGIDPKTGKLREDLGMYTVISRAPVADPKEPTDLIFELDVFKRGLLDNLPATVKPEDKTEAVQFRNFLNEQLAINLKGGLKCRTPAKEIIPKPYGPKDRPQGFVPITYSTPEGATLYTFTSVCEDKIWMMKFLVSKGQEDTYGALIAFTLYNTFGMTKKDFDDWVKNQPRGENPKPKPAAPKTGGGKGK